MKQDEFSPLPREFEAVPPEFSPPGPEFNDHAPGVSARPRKKRYALAAAAVLLLAPIVLPDTVSAPALPVPTETVSAPAETIPAPEESIAVPEETVPPETEVAGPPECRLVFFAFSDSLRAKLSFTNPDAILSVHAELWDSESGTLEQEWEVLPEAIAKGEYYLPDMMGMFEIYMTHHESYDPTDAFPVPELRVAMTYLDGDTEVTEEYSQSYTEEQGWSARIADGEIRFRTYESYEPITLFAGDDTSDPETLKSGELMVVVQINGETVPADQCEVSTEEETWFTSDGESISFYYASLTTPKKGESDEVLVTVYQKLQGYDTVWSETVGLMY